MALTRAEKWWISVFSKKDISKEFSINLKYILILHINQLKFSCTACIHHAFKLSEKMDHCAAGCGVHPVHV
jgi:hypothetical protein